MHRRRAPHHRLDPDQRRDGGGADPRRAARAQAAPTEAAQGRPRPLVYPFDPGARVGRGDVHAHADPRRCGTSIARARRGSSRSTTSSSHDIRGDDARAVARRRRHLRRGAARRGLRGRRAPDRRHRQERADRRAARAAACGCTSIPIARRRDGSRGMDDNGELVVSIDLGGGSLSQRGWRREAGEAPLREHLAAVLLMLCRFDPRNDILVDPMCGSGTIPIEAVLAGARDRRARRPILARARHLIAAARAAVRGREAARDRLRRRSRRARRRPRQRPRRRRREAMSPGSARTSPRCGRRRSRTSRASAAACRDDRRPAVEPAVRRAARRAPICASSTPRSPSTCQRFTGWRAGFLVGNPLLEEVFYGIVGAPRIKKPLANANLRAYFFLYEL